MSQLIGVADTMIEAKYIFQKNNRIYPLMHGVAICLELAEQFWLQRVKERIPQLPLGTCESDPGDVRDRLDTGSKS